MNMFSLLLMFVVADADADAADANGGTRNASCRTRRTRLNFPR